MATALCTLYNLYNVINDYIYFPIIIVVLQEINHLLIPMPFSCLLCLALFLFGIIYLMKYSFNSSNHSWGHTCISLAAICVALH